MFYAITIIRNEQGHIIERNDEMDEDGNYTGVVSFHAVRNAVAGNFQITSKIKLNATTVKEAFEDNTKIDGDGRTQAALEAQYAAIQKQAQEFARQQAAQKPAIQMPRRG